jgi:hypothetical protein
MKKLILFVSICLFTSSYTIGQTYHPFPTDSAQWSILVVKDLPSYHYYTVHLKMKGDTLLKNTNYKKIYYSTHLPYSWPDDSINCFIREDTNKRIWVKYPVGSGIDTTEMRLYDFYLNVNDTFNLRLLNYSTDSMHKITVINIGGETTHIDYRLSMEFKTTGIDTVYGMWGSGCDDIVWISGIGCVRGLLYNEIPQYSCWTESYNLQCYQEKGIYILGGTFCDQVSVNEYIGSNSRISIFPNPATDKIMIEFADRQQLHLYIYNLVGDLILQKEFDNTQKEIDISSLATGMYIIKAIGADWTVQKKMIKQ